MVDRRRTRAGRAGDRSTADRRADEPSDPSAPADPFEFGLETPGSEEVPVVPWPLLWQRRVAARVERSESYPWLVLTAALFGLFSVGFSITVLTVSIPTIARDLGSSESLLIWTITGPILLGAIVAPAAGKLADVLGARRVYLVAMVMVAVFAGLSAAAWDAPALIAFRVLGAATGSATGPASLAIINRLFPRERRAQALGFWSLVAAFGPVVGVIAGGPIVQAVSWRWIFIVQVPLTLATVALCAAVFPETDRNRGARFDAVGASLLGLGVGSILVALNRGPEAGWSHPLVVGGFVVGPALLVTFAVVERRIAHPLIPIAYFPRRNFAFGMANQFFSNFAYMGGFYLTPFLLQHVLGYEPARTGLISTTRPLAFAIAGPFAGWLATRIGERVNVVAGGLFLLVSMAVFTTVAPGTDDLVIIVALVLSGVGMGTTAPAMAAAIANAVDERDLGVVGAAQQMVSQVGVVAGIQLLVTVQQARADVVGEVAGYADGYRVGAAAALLGTVAALFVRSTTDRAARLAASDPTEVGASGASGASGTALVDA